MQQVDVRTKILYELAFFVALVIASEVARLVVRRARPDSLHAAQALRVSSLVLAWYSVSITLVLFNKWFITSFSAGGLPYPLFYTMNHMLLKGLFSLAFLGCWRRKLPQGLPCRLWAQATIIGAMTAFDVAASMVSFRFVSVAFYTMLKSASLIFMLAFSVMARVETCSLQILGTVLVIATGICLASYGEVQFSLLGFGLVVASEVFAAVRWVLTQTILQEAKLDAVTTVLCISPGSTLSLLPLALGHELAHLQELANDPVTAAHYFKWICFPGVLAFLLLLVEVQLVKETSSLTLTVFGNLKSVVTIVFSVLVLGDSTSALQWLGLSLSLLGIFAYSRGRTPKQIHAVVRASQSYVYLDDEILDRGASCQEQVAKARKADAASPVGSLDATNFGAISSEASEAHIELESGPDSPGALHNDEPHAMQPTFEALDLDDEEDAGSPRTAAAEVACGG